MVTFPKIVINLHRTLEKVHIVKENHIGSAVSEILQYKETVITHRYPVIFVLEVKMTLN